MRTNINAMIANPPKNPTAAQWHISVAWPVDVLQTADSSQRVVVQMLYSPPTPSQLLYQP